MNLVENYNTHTVNKTSNEPAARVNDESRDAYSEFVAGTGKTHL